MDKISVIMSTYKEPIEWVVKCIESVVNQTVAPYEYIIVVDDPENIDMINMLKEYESKHSFIKVLINDVNMGLVKSLNKALEYCTGDYIARIDADDYAVPERFEKQLNYSKEKQYDIVGAGYTVFYNDKVLDKRFGKTNDKLCKKLLRYCDCVAHPTWFVKREVYEKLNGYRNIDACEDLDFLIRAALMGFKLGCVSEQLMWYRDNPNSISHLKNNKQQVIRDFLCTKYQSGKPVSVDEYNDFVASNAFDFKVKALEELYTYQNSVCNKNGGVHGKINKLSLLFSNSVYRTQKLTNMKIRLTNKIYG